MLNRSKLLFVLFLLPESKSCVKVVARVGRFFNVVWVFSRCRPVVSVITDDLFLPLSPPFAAILLVPYQAGSPQCDAVGEDGLSRCSVEANQQISCWACCSSSLAGFFFSLRLRDCLSRRTRQRGGHQRISRNAQAPPFTHSHRKGLAQSHAPAGHNWFHGHVGI